MSWTTKARRLYLNRMCECGHTANFHIPIDASADAGPMYCEEPGCPCPRWKERVND